MEFPTKTSHDSPMSACSVPLNPILTKQYSRVIDGSYLIIERLGCSSTDVKMVFLVEEIERKRRCVLKFFTPDEMESFSEEAQANMRLLHNSSV